MVPFESFGTVSYSHSIATVAVFLAVLTQHTIVTDTRPATARHNRRASTVLKTVVRKCNKRTERRAGQHSAPVQQLTVSLMMTDGVIVCDGDSDCK